MKRGAKKKRKKCFRHNRLAFVLGAPQYCLHYRLVANGKRQLQLIEVVSLWLWQRARWMASRQGYSLIRRRQPRRERKRSGHGRGKGHARLYKSAHMCVATLEVIFDIRDTGRQVRGERDADSRRLKGHELQLPAG